MKILDCSCLFFSIKLVIVLRVRYFCDQCNFWDDQGEEKEVFHCDKCGLRAPQRHRSRTARDMSLILSNGFRAVFDRVSLQLHRGTKSASAWCVVGAFQGSFRPLGVVSARAPQRSPGICAPGRHLSRWRAGELLPLRHLRQLLPGRDPGLAPLRGERDAQRLPGVLAWPLPLHLRGQHQRVGQSGGIGAVPSEYQASAQGYLGIALTVHAHRLPLPPPSSPRLLARPGTDVGDDKSCRFII